MSLTQVAFPDNFTTIENDMFMGCVSLANITIPTSVTNLGTYAFSGCSSLTRVYFLGAPPAVEIPVFPGDYAATVYYSATIRGWNSPFAELPAVPTAAPTEFIYSTNDSTLTITGYTGLGGSVVIPFVINGLLVANIADGAFQNLTNLASVTIPGSITNIGDLAFGNCANLTSVYFIGNAPTVGSSVFESDSNATVYFYPGTAGWSSYIGGLWAGPATPVTDFNYTINAGPLTITGYTGQGGAVTIPSAVNGTPVTGIGSFGNSAGSASLTSIAIPDSITNISTYACSRCARLTAIVVATNNPNYSSLNGVLFDKSQATLIQFPCGVSGSYTNPAGVTSIGTAAFENCTNLTGVTLSDGVVSIGTAAFASCTSLATAGISGSVTNLGTSAFGNCTNLLAFIVDSTNPAYSSLNGVLFNKTHTTLIQFPAGVAGSYTIPGGVLSIGDFVFADCRRLTDITIPNGVAKIGQYAFEFCNGLTNVTIPPSVTSIGDYAFAQCPGLRGVFFAGDAPVFGLSVGANDPLTKLYYLPDRAGWTSLPGFPLVVWIPYNYTTNEGAITITDYYGPGGPVVMPAALNGKPVTSIAANAFLNQTTVTSVTIPGSITNLGDNAFSGCTNLTAVYFSGNAPTVGSSVFASDSNATAYFFPGAIGWSSPFADIPATLQYTSQTQFRYATNAGVITIFGYSGPGGSVYIPPAINGRTVTTILESAFYRNASLTNLTISASVTNIATLAFAYSGLQTVTFSDGVSAIGPSAFAYCTNLASITIPNSVTNIGQSAFYDCAKLVSVTIPASVAYIGDGAFFDCYLLRNVYFMGNPPAIGVNAFQSDISATGYYFPGASGWTPSLGGLPVLPWIPFNYTTNGLAITITGYSGPGGAVNVPATINHFQVTNIAAGAFENHTNITSVIIPGNIITIGDLAFSGCSNLTSVYFAGNAPTVGSSVFGFDTNATVYYLAGTTGWTDPFAGLPTALWIPTYKLGTTSILAGPSSGTNSVVLAVSPGVTAWTAVANGGWLHLTAANQSGVGSTNVIFNYDPNPGPTRSGTLTIGDQTLTVSQAGSTYVAARPVTTLVSTGLNLPWGVAVDGAGNVHRRYWQWRN